MDGQEKALSTGMTGGLIGLVVALIAATAVGLVLRRRAGRFRPVGSATTTLPSSAAPSARSASPGPATSAVAASRGRADPAAAGAAALTDADLGAPLGERATLVQFSTAFCAPCRPTRQILSQVAGMVDGVVHIDIDATSRLDLVQRLRINSAPTILVLGPDGFVARRATGLPRKADVIAALGQVMGPDRPAGSATLVAGTGNVTEARIGPGSDSRSESE
jgi:thiol-disulfide isomerase/thioredoxin